MAEGDEQAPPSIAERLSWNVEEKGELPAELATLSLDDVRGFADQIRTESQAEADRREQAARVAEQSRVRESAEAKIDADYYADLNARLKSPDEAIKSAAVTELGENEDRYHRGADIARRTSADTMRRTAIADLYDTMVNELGQAQMAALPKRDSAEFAQFAVKLADYDAKGGLAGFLIDYGKGLAAEAEYARGKEDGARAERIALGVKGAPEMAGGNGTNTTEKYDDPAWVAQQKKSDPEWPYAMSPDGKLTNVQRVRRAAVGAARKAG